MNKSGILGFLLIVCAPFANATLITSTSTSDFNLTLESFSQVSLGTNNNIVSQSGLITLDNAAGIGDPVTGTHGFVDWVGSTMTGLEYVLNGDENFDVIFSSLQNVFAFNYEDDSIASLFELTFYNGNTEVNTGSFTTSVFDTEQFIAFVSDVAFNRVSVRESDGGNSNNTNEYFQFYQATTVDVSAPSAILLFGLALMGLTRVRFRSYK